MMKFPHLGYDAMNFERCIQITFLPHIPKFLCVSHFYLNHLLSTNLLTSTNLFFILKFLPFPEGHLSGIVEYLHLNLAVFIEQKVAMIFRILMQ